MALRDDFGDAERLVAHDTTGQFAAGDITLDHDSVAVTPFARCHHLRRMRLIFLDDDDTEAGAFAHRLDDIWRLHRML
ncbi:hypothetical protein D3C87_2000730 [compost metagenome]